MGWLKKTLAKVGVGSAKVHIELQAETLRQGETVSATLVVTGGDVPQPVDAVELTVCCDYMGWEQLRTQGEQGRKKQRRRKTHILSTWALPDAFTTEPGVERRVETEFTLPLATPLSLGEGKVWLEVNLNIPMGKDTSAKAPLTVKPEAMLDTALNVFEQAGFRIEKVKNEEVERKALPFEQRLTFVPVSAPYQGVFRNLVLVASRQEDTLQLAMTFSRDGDGIGAALGRFVGANQLHRDLSFGPSSTDISSQINTLLRQISQ